MSVVDIAGAWKSVAGLVYIITQVGDMFVWRVVHKNGVTETGIGRFVNPGDKEEKPEVIAQWNFHGGNVAAKDSSRCRGKVFLDDNLAVRIEWDDHDHFVQRI